MTRAIRVLHLEDSPRDAEMIRHHLGAMADPCDILLTNSREGFEGALSREPFDVILSDYNLPGYDGITALKKAQAAQPDVPVILISGTVGEEQAVRCLQIGATDYLLKDHLERLVPAVQRALEEAETLRARKRVELALGVSESRKAAILDSVLDCIITMDSAGIVIEFNAAAVRTFGYTKTAAIGRPLADLIIPPQFRAMHNAGLARYLATGEAALIGRLIEVTALRSDGSEIPIELAITAIGSGADSVFTGVARDITVRQQAEATRQAAEATVRMAEERMRFALQGAEVGIWDMDYVTGLLEWSAILESQYCMEPGTFDGTYESFMARVHPDDRAAFAATIDGAMKAGGDFTTLHRVICPDSSVRWLSGAGRVHLDASGQPVRAVGISLDTSARHLLE